MRVVGIDLGTRRIGVAVSDATGTLASPHTVIRRSGDPAADRRRLAEVVAELGAERVVVGLPLSLSGRAGPAARAAGEESEALAAVVHVPVETYDERLTTRMAEASRRAGAEAAEDSLAAAHLLEGYLAARREGGAT